MESKTKNKKTREQIEDMVRRAFSGLGLAAGEDAVTELKEGWFNAAYNIRLTDGREVILKIAPPQDAEVMTYEKNLMATEVAAMRLVRQNPLIPAPEVYFFDQARDLCDADYFFMEKIQGENLEHAKENLSPEVMQAIEFRIGEIVREINGFSGSYFGYDGNPDLRAETWKDAFIKIIDSLLDDAARKNVTFDFSYAELRDAVVRHSSALEEVTQPRLVHWDAWNLNFFVKDGAVSGILDFERALWADPLMEAQFRALFFGQGITPSLRGYGKTSFIHTEGQRNYLYTLHLALVMNIEHFYRHYDTDDVFNMSRQFISKAMEWLKNN
ncbi:MAG: aminoglycoside phosphotransferase family protein [Anaerolineales bacterium]